MKIVSLFLMLVSCCASPARAQLSGQVLPDSGSFREVFAANNKFHAGQTLTISVSGQIDANHRYWEDRECSWFGLKCKWVKRESSNLMGPDRLPLLVALEPAAGLSAPVQVNEPQWHGNTAELHLPASSDGSYRFVIEVPDAYKSIDGFGTGVTLLAAVADRYKPDVSIDRGQCRDRPPQCSSGAYKVTVTVDNAQRLNFLEQLLKERHSSGELLSRDVMDPLFIEDIAVKPRIADALFRHAQKYHKGDSTDARREYLAIVSFASSLDPKRNDMLNEIAATYIALGEYTTASATVKVAMDSAKAKFEKEPRPRSAATVTELATATALRASIWVQERGAMLGTDLMVAVGLYRDASTYCNTEAAIATTSADKQTLYNCAKDHLIDAARTVAMLRTRDNLIFAEQLLTEAQGAARKVVDVD